MLDNNAELMGDGERIEGVGEKSWRGRRVVGRTCEQRQTEKVALRDEKG
jgi:hypothetical protein